MADYYAVTAAASILGICIYPFTFATKSVRWTMSYGIVFVTAIQAIDLVLLTHTNRSLGIPDFTFLCIYGFLHTMAESLLAVPLLSICALFCPAGIEGAPNCGSYWRCFTVCI